MCGMGGSFGLSSAIVPAEGPGVMNGCYDVAGRRALQRADWLRASALCRRALAIKMQSFALKDAGYTDMIYARAFPDTIL